MNRKERTAAIVRAFDEDGLDGRVSKYEMKLSINEDSYVYELFFICDSVKYEVAVDAISGGIVSLEKVVLTETGAPSVEDGSHISAEGN